MGDAETLLRMLLMHGSGGPSLEQTVLRARKQDQTISAVALFKRLRRSEAFLQDGGSRGRRRPSASPTGASGAARSYHFYGGYQRFNGPAASLSRLTWLQCVIAPVPMYRQ